MDGELEFYLFGWTPGSLHSCEVYSSERRSCCTVNADRQAVHRSKRLRNKSLSIDHESAGHRTSLSLWINRFSAALPLHTERAFLPGSGIFAFAAARLGARKPTFSSSSRSWVVVLPWACLQCCGGQRNLYTTFSLETPKTCFNIRAYLSFSFCAYKINSSFLHRLYQRHRHHSTFSAFYLASSINSRLLLFFGLNSPTALEVCYVTIFDAF